MPAFGEIIGGPRTRSGKTQHRPASRWAIATSFILSRLMGQTSKTIPSWPKGAQQPNHTPAKFYATGFRCIHAQGALDANAVASSSYSGCAMHW